MITFNHLASDIETAYEAVDISVGITSNEFDNMTRGLRPCGCGVENVEPSPAYPDGKKIVRCGRHRGVRTYGA